MRAVLSDPGINTNPDTSEPTNIGTMPDLHSIIDNVLNVAADVYIRDKEVSRYIHRNPVETKKPLANRLVDYRWSSYPAYLNNGSLGVKS